MVALHSFNPRPGSPARVGDHVCAISFPTASMNRLAVIAFLLTQVWAMTASTSFGQGLPPAPGTPPSDQMQSPQSPTGLPAVSVDVLNGVCTTFSDQTGGQDHAAEVRRGAFVFRLDPSNALSVSIDDKAQYSLDGFSFSNRYECVGKLAELFSHPPLNPVRSCRIPQNGVEKYRTSTVISQQSPEMGGGHNQPEWCSTLVAILRGQYPSGEFTPVSSSEMTRNHCSPFNCPQYIYMCTVRVDVDPVYKLAQSPNCP